MAAAPSQRSQATSRQRPSQCTQQQQQQQPGSLYQLLDPASFPSHPPGANAAAGTATAPHPPAPQQFLTATSCRSLAGRRREELPCPISPLCRALRHRALSRSCPCHTRTHGTEPKAGQLGTPERERPWCRGGCCPGPRGQELSERSETCGGPRSAPSLFPAASHRAALSPPQQPLLLPRAQALLRPSHLEQLPSRARSAPALFASLPQAGQLPALGRLLQGPRLTCLHLRDNELGAQGVLQLCRQLRHPACPQRSLASGPCHGPFHARHCRAGERMLRDRLSTELDALRALQPVLKIGNLLEHDVPQAGAMAWLPSHRGLLPEGRKALPSF
ncbi:uncharacterized protein LOC116997708 [Catharus ustulatus]|uniref:uncharacterized protein LOC116997708 n=1 Tax=Catharus ustulatus TaxID=91951 RepID=UPI001408A393|nr:uncharacterized protein LOC116997708 [Catharus ustulatus]